MTEKRTLKKLENDNFLLTIDNEENKHHQDKMYTKDELKETYTGLKMQLNQHKIKLSQTVKAVNNTKIVLTKEEEELREKMNNIGKFVEYDKHLQQQKFEKADIDLFNNHIKEIERAIPELTRKNK